MTSFLRRESRGLKVAQTGLCGRVNASSRTSIWSTAAPMLADIKKTVTMQRPPNLEVQVVLSLFEALSRRPAVVKHSRFCARGGSTWKSPPSIASNVVAGARWQTTENSLRLHCLCPWLENQHSLAIALATPSNNVTMPATKRPRTIPSSESWVVGSCSPAVQLAERFPHSRSPAVVVFVSLQSRRKEGLPPSLSAPHPGLIATVRRHVVFLQQHN